MARWLLAMLPLAVLTSCATPEPEPSPAPAPVIVAPVPEPAPPPASAPVPVPRHDKLKHLTNRKFPPLPVRPLNAKARCNFRDANGYRGRLHLDVKDASVKHFEARVDVPQHGSCHFRLADFRQSDTLPNVVLAARGGDCKVSLWEPGEQVTVAFRGCRTECSGDSVDYLWPILVDNRKGLCS